METEWVHARIELYQLIQTHPEWTNAHLAEALGRSLSWVKKWKKRFRETLRHSIEMFLSHSRAPKQPVHKVHEQVRKTILALRDGLGEVYHRVIGPKLILYHLQRDEALQRQGHRLPTSTHTIWKVLKEAGRIPERIYIHHPIERPDPMEEWEFDFGMSTSLVPEGLEFLVVVDRGTSILVNTQCSHGYDAESALAAIARVLLLNGLPKRLRFDRDTRFVGSWSTHDYPSALVRFLWCLGVEPVICPPRRPDLKPFVERSVRTVKHECLYVHRPDHIVTASELLDTYNLFYNADRPNQALSCGNVPPYEAFPFLPTLPTLPDQVDPDAWLNAYQGRVFRRHVSKSGSVMVGKDHYYIGKAWCGQRIALHLDAHHQQFQVQHNGKLIKKLNIKGLHKQVMNFQDYLKLMMAEARSIEQYLQRKTHQRQT